MIRVVVAGEAETADPAARAMRDAGMEVIYAGHHREPAQLVDTALQEDAGAIALTGTAAAGVIRELLAARGAGDITVIAFPAGTPPDEIVDRVRVGRTQ
jgi:isobutyryl-CoA mutase small subunit